MKLNTFKKTRVVVTTMGSLGDLNPYIALALELKGVDKKISNKRHPNKKDEFCTPSGFFRNPGQFPSSYFKRRREPPEKPL